MPDPGVDTAVPDEHCQSQNCATPPRPDSPTATTSTKETSSAEKSHAPEGGQNHVCRCGQEPGTGATNGQTPSQSTDLENCTGRSVDSARPGSCRKYVLKVCRALILFGAPTHRLEQYVHHTGDALDLHIQSFYMPGCMIMSFDNQAQESIDLQIVRSTQALNLAKLYDIHTVYKNVIHKKTTVEDAVTQIDEITDRPESFPLWLRVLVYGLASMCIGPVSYNAQPVDLPIIFILGSLVGLSELVLAPKSELYGYVFETCAAILASFIGRAFGSIHWGQDQSFCFSAISQASIVLILPGFAITSSALELQSKNMVSGAVRMVWAIVYTLFLSFGFTIGITIYGAIHHDATSETQCRTTYPVWWPIAFVLPFTFCYVIVNKGNWKQMPPMLGISLAGWCVNHFSSQRFAAVPTISQALGALTVGVLANLYARIEHGMAVALMHPAIYLQVPGSLAASGSLISGLSNADQLNKNGSTDAPREAMFSDLNAGYTMAQIGIAITVGLSISVLLVYPIRKKARSGIFSL